MELFLSRSEYDFDYLRTHCRYCNSYLHMFAPESHHMHVLPLLLARGTVIQEWAIILLSSGRFHFIWQMHILPFCAHYSRRSYRAYGSCRNIGTDAALACRWRTLVLMPLLEGTSLIFWGFTRGMYHETIELILMFLQGALPTVIRPHPSCARLQRHGYLWLHPRLADLVDALPFFRSVSYTHLTLPTKA